MICPFASPAKYHLTPLSSSRSAAYARAAMERAEAFALALARDLDRCAALERETMAILAELAALAAGGLRLAMV